MTGFADVVTSAQRRAEYLAAGHWNDRTMAGQARRHAAERPDDVAVVDERGPHTWAELVVDAGRAAAWLQQHGVEPGSVVSLQLPNRYEAVVAAVAAQGVGAVINPLLPSYRAHELSHVFRTARPQVIFTPREYRGHDHEAMVGDVVRATGVAPHHVVVDDGWAPDGDGELPAGEASLVSEVIFTSGTEATPKAVMHTEQTAGFSVRVAYDDLRMGPDDVVWMPSPVGHSTGFNYGLRFAVHHGLRLVLQDRWEAEAAAALVAGEGCTYTLAATTFLQDLVGAASRSGVDLSSLHLFGCGGAPVPPPLVDAAAAVGITVLRLYGSTEVLVATWNRPWDDVELRRTTDGRPMSHVEVELHDGEIVTRGPNTCVGFFDDEERTAATFQDGWVRSGDIATIDDRGHLTMVGRKKEILIRGGLNIAPREIEELIVAFPEVERVAVIGLPDERLGERMCACVTLVDGALLDLATLVERLLSRGLAKFKLPEQLEVLEVLPMTASGKIQKHELIRRLTS
jgi:acyl-CoA synthetase (AMP-forming)/AMP-acid ligase II